MTHAPVKQEFRWSLRKKGKHVFNVCKHIFVYGGVSAALMVSTADIAAANPQGGNVVGGSATITDTASELQINQHSDRALIEWASFNIGKGETTRFIQPNSNAIALNRVVNSNQISALNGNLTANGRVIVINPNGVLIGPDGNIDTASFIATSADVDDDAFMNGSTVNFNHAGNADAVVENQGSISVDEAGLAALVAPTVRNSGVIQANLAKVQLAAADTFAVDFYGDGLISYAVNAPAEGETRAVTAENSGDIFADGGQVLMTAAAATDVVDAVINSDGYIQAASLENHGGKIVLTGAGATVNVSGKMDVSGQGDADGGEILIGGDYQGGGDVATAKNTTVTETAELKADAGENGDGGKIITWADDAAVTRGKYYARGGSVSGDGGLIETSGKSTIDFVGTTADATAANGDGGVWLIDPTTLYIDQTYADTISASPTDVILSTTDGATIDGDINIAALNVDLSITAGGSGINAANNYIRTNSGDVTFVTSGAIDLNKTTIFTTGGDVYFLGKTVSMNNNAAIGTEGGSVYMEATSTGGGDTISLNNSAIDTSGGTTAGGIDLLDLTNTPHITGTDAQKAAWAGNAQTHYDSSQNGGTVTLKGKSIKTNSVCINAGGSLACGVVADPVATDIIVTIDSFTKIYGAADPVFTWGITSGTLSGSDALSVNLARILQNTLAGEQVGNYDIYQTAYSVIGSGLYNITFVNGNLQIIPASLVIKAVDQTKTYGDTLVLDETDPSSDYTVTGLISNINGFTTGDTVDGVSLTSAGTVATAGVAGSPYTITASNATGTNLSNYTITYQTGDLTVNKALLTVTADGKSMTYGGTAPALTDTITGFVNGETAAVIDTTGSVASGTLFTADAGTYTDTLNASGFADDNYAFQYVPGDLTINKAALSVTALNDSKVYDGLAYSGGNGVNITGFVNGDTVGDLGGTLGYTGTSQGATNVGSYVITPGGYTSGNYTITYNNGALNITKALLAITANNQTKTYGDSFSFAGTEFTTSGLQGSDAVSSVVLTSPATPATANAGSYAITASGAAGTGLSNYTISYNPGTFTVNKKLLTVTADDKSMTYGGLAPTLTATYTGFVNGDTTGDIDTLAALASGTAFTADAGTYTNTLTASGAVDNNYSFAYNAGDLTINKAVLTGFTNSFAKVYDGLAYSGGNGVTYIGFVNGDTVGDLSGTLSYSGTSQGATNVGSYILLGGGQSNSNYTINYLPSSLNITPATLFINALNQSKTYGDTFSFNGNEFSTTGLVNGETLTTANLSSTGSVATANVAGSPYAIVISNATGGTANLSNYSVHYVNGQMTVNPAALTITANNQTKTYGDTFTFNGNEFTTSGLKNSETLTSASLNSLGSPSTATVGTYDINISGATGGTADLNNYNVSYVKGTMTVDKAALLLVAANNQTKTYGDSFTFNGTEFTPTGLLNSDTVTSATLTSAATPVTANAGSYVISISNAVGTGLGNYTISYQPGTFTVNKKLLTVTANDKSMTYGGLAPTLTATYTGFVNGDTTGDIDTLAALASGTAFTADAGTYTNTLTASGAVDNNYSFAYNAGDLTINPAALLVTAANDTKVYNAVAYTGGNGVTYSGFVNGDSAGSNDLTGTVAYSGTSQGATNVGGYVITPGGLASNNYSISYANGALNITPAALTITAANQSKTYGQNFIFDMTDPSTDYSVVGLLGTDAVSSVILSSAGAPAAANAGSYNIDVSNAAGTGLGNYTINYVDGTMTVNKANLTVTANNDGKIYDGLAYSGGNGVNITGFQNGDTVGNLGGTLGYTGTSQGATNVGSYAITPGGYTSGNYTITYNNGTLSITPAKLVITALDQTKTYGDNFIFAGTEFSTSGLQNGETVGSATITSAGAGPLAGVAAGPYTINISGATGGTADLGNYAVSYNTGLFTVNKKLLTVRVVDKSMTYGGTFPGYTATATGFVNGENYTVIDTIGPGATSVPFNSDAGFYADALTTSGFADDNYSFAYVAGDLTITPAALSITANDLSKIYDATTFSGGNGVVYSGFVNGDSVGSNDLTGALAYSGSSQGAKNVGTYVITPGGFNSNNYTITYNNGALNITPAKLTVTANDFSKVYDDTFYSGGNGVTYSGFVGGETLGTSDVTGAITYGGSSQGAKHVGTYVISASGLNSGNYAISYVDGALNITKANLEIIANNQTKTYGDDFTFTGQEFTTVGLQGDDQILNVLLSSTGAPATANTGTYLVDLYGYSYLTADQIGRNYNITLTDGTMTVNPAELVITANDDTKIYDGVPYSGGNGVTFSGFKNGDDQSVLGGILAYSGSSQGAVDPGSYLITPGGFKARNYNITYVDGALDINPAPLSFLEIDPLGRPIISVANQAIVLDEPFEEIETLELLTDVGISSTNTGAATGPEALAGIAPAAGEEEGSEGAEQVASIEPAAGGEGQQQGQGGEEGEFAQDIACANSFLENKPCDQEQGAQ